MRKYYPRISDTVLLDHLESKGAVLIEGAKWCGKTTSAKHIAKSVIEMDRPDIMKKPSFLMVLCGVAPFAYRREDGVFVVPISCLRD